MSHRPFTSRSSGVLFWGASYLSAAIAWGVVLASAWPQGGVCSTSCGARLDAGAAGMGLVAIGGLVGFGVTVWLGVTRRPLAPRRLVAVLVGALVASLVTAFVLVRSAPSGDEASGLALARSTWSWALAVPSSALLTAAGAGLARARVGRSRARTTTSVRARRA